MGAQGATEPATARGGRDSIDYTPGANDDLCNSVAGVVAELSSGRLLHPTGCYPASNLGLDRMV